MSETKIEKEVGFKCIDDSDPNNVRTYYELDYGSNCYGDVDLFYRDPTEDHPGGGICYIRTVEGGVIYEDAPEFWGVAYTYDDVLKICEGHKNAADLALEKAGGYGIEVMWDEIEDILEDEGE